MRISAWMLVLKLDEWVILNRVSMCFSSLLRLAITGFDGPKTLTNGRPT